MNAAKKLHNTFEEHRKHDAENPEERHEDINWQRRMEGAQLKAEELLPEDSHQLKRIIEHLHACRKLMTEGLEHKQ